MRQLTRPWGRRGLLFFAIAIVASAFAGAAFAFWSNTDASNSGAAVADSVQAGNTPTLGGVSGSSVTLNWAATTTAGGASVSGYTINRYSLPSGGTPTTATGGCSGTVGALTCTEPSAPDGLWYYAVTPKIGLWTGAESGRLSVRVDTVAPITTDNSASIGSSWFNTTKTVTLSPTDTGGSGVASTYYTTNGTTPTTGSTQGTSLVLATDGVYTAKYFSVDNTGNAEAVKTAGTAIRIDKTNPATGTLGVAAAVKNGGALTTAPTDPTVNGASSGVSSVSYYYCSGASCTPSTLIGTSSTGPGYSVTWSSQPTDGTYRVQAVATDAAGNTGSSTIGSTIVDNTAPSGGSVSYTNGYFTTASVGVTMANGTDGGSGVNTATTQLLRTATTLAAGACGTFGSPISVGAAGAASPYSDTSVASASCYQYQYRVSDNAGNTSTYTSVNVAKVDTTAPVFTTTSTGTNVFWSGSTVYFKASGSGSFTVTATDPESGVTSSTFPTTFANWLVSGSGNARTFTLNGNASSSSITVSASNGAGTSSGNQSITTTVDGTQPVFANTDLRIAPIGNTTTAGFVKQGAQYYVYANATDATSGVSTVTANVNNITTGSTAVPLVAGTYNAFGTTYAYRSAALTANAGLTAGNKTYTGTAIDSVANTRTTANATVVADNTNPTGSITTPSNGFAGPSATVTSSSADATAGVASAQFQYSPAGAGTWSTIGTDATTPYTLSWDTTALTNGGSYDLRVVTTDNASNTFTSTTVTVTVDRTAPAAPSTPVLAPASDGGVAGDNLTNDTTPTLTGTAEAGATISVYSGATLAGTTTATVGGTWSFTSASAAPDGVYVITATATDAAGNLSPASGALTITIETVLPTPVDIVLANGGLAQRLDTGDTVTVTYSEQLHAVSLCSTWSNSGNQTLSNVTATVTNAGGTDTVAVTSPTCTLNFGSALLGDYLSATATFTSSTLTWNPVAKTLTLTFGTQASGTIRTGVTAIAPRYTPVVAITDLAGNAMAATQFTDNATSGF